MAFHVLGHVVSLSIALVVVALVTMGGVAATGDHRPHRRNTSKRGR